VVTGAFGALGTAVARRFAGRGVRVGLLGREPVPASARQEFGTTHVLLGGVDLTVQEAANAAMQAVAAAGGGRIVNIGAGAAGRAAAGMGAYAASKAGVERLTEALAAELRDRNVTVNAILPGTIDTPANRAAMPDADVTRWVEPEAVADVVVFLASDAARAVTGAALRVFGRG
jgi:NAD(P)-dependent dehydrogenase (short-subunit alcohol dehydrogenase family)